MSCRIIEVLYSYEFRSLNLQHIQVLFDGLTKRVKRITNKDSEISVSVDQGFYWYNSSDGHNKNSTQASGAYIFR